MTMPVLEEQQVGQLRVLAGLSDCLAEVQLDFLLVEAGWHQVLPGLVVGELDPVVELPVHSAEVGLFRFLAGSALEFVDSAAVKKALCVALPVCPAEIGCFLFGSLPQKRLEVGWQGHCFLVGGWLLYL